MPDLRQLYSPCLSADLPPVAFLEFDNHVNKQPPGFDNHENKQNKAPKRLPERKLYDASPSTKAAVGLERDPKIWELGLDDNEARTWFAPVDSYFNESTKNGRRIRKGSTATTATPPTSPPRLSSPGSSDSNVIPYADSQNLCLSHGNSYNIPGYNTMMMPGYPGYVMVAMPPANAAAMTPQVDKSDKKSKRPAGKKKDLKTNSTDATPTEDVTTLMVRGIPCSFSQETLMSLIDHAGLMGKYDFFYLPRAGNNGSNLGYSFINFVDHESAELMSARFNGIPLDISRSSKVCTISAADIQGLKSLKKHFRRTAVSRGSRGPIFMKGVPKKRKGSSETSGGTRSNESLPRTASNGSMQYDGLLDSSSFLWV